MAHNPTSIPKLEYDPLDFRYLIVRPEKGRMWDVLKYSIWAECGIRFLESSDDNVLGGEAADHKLIILISVIVRKFLHIFSKPMQFTGFIVDFCLNLVSQNGGFLRLFRNLVSGNVVIPQRGTKTFISTIGQIDDRIELYHGRKIVEKLHASTSGNSERVQAELGSRELMDLCMMASKLAYENAEIVRNVVVHHWKMHFVDFYNCWDDFQKENSTQVFILCDKPKDASLILISFRGTEPFDADDWSTDFDYSWFEIPNLGKIHMGFLEALGLGNRNDTTSFHSHLQTTNNSLIPPEMVEKTAYHIVRTKLETLLKEHENAKFIVTGHSLGGALAILFPTVLVLLGEMGIMERMLCVYTFGQPRIGDEQIGKYMEPHLDYPVQRYFRIVYCNDLVPRLPYDDKTFLFKHFGQCLYYDSRYNEHGMDEEPNKNFFGITSLIPEHVNAVWELIRGLTMRYTHGEEYKEGWFSICVRIMGLAMPGIAAHCPTDYVNSIRLGRNSVLPTRERER